MALLSVCAALLVIFLQDAHQACLGVSHLLLLIISSLAVLFCWYFIPEENEDAAHLKIVWHGMNVRVLW